MAETMIMANNNIAGMKLPNGERADLGVKREDYVLNPLHLEGKHKAHVFASVLSITLANVQVLRNALLDAAAFSDQVEPRGDNGFGEVYVLRFPLDTTTGTATVLSAWIIRHGEDFPRLHNLLYRLIHEYPISCARCRRTA